MGLEMAQEFVWLEWDRLTAGRLLDSDLTLMAQSCRSEFRRRVVVSAMFPHEAETNRWSKGKSTMFSHVMVGTNDLDKAKVFYDALLGALDVSPALVDGHRIFYMTQTGVFGVSKPINGQPASAANGGTIGFACSSPQQVDAWHAAGIANNGTSCEDLPGVRDRGAAKLYLAYLRDPDGNKLCAMHRMD